MVGGSWMMQVKVSWREGLDLVVAVAEPPLDFGVGEQLARVGILPGDLDDGGIKLNRDHAVGGAGGFDGGVA